MKPFEKWETEEVERTFGITQADSLDLMDTWLAYQTTFSQHSQEETERLRIRLKKMATYWTEEDIKVFFIMPIIDLVEFYVPNLYRTFMEATLEADLTDAQGNACTLRGRVEMVVATGKQRPQTPFFFLNEYKPQIKGQSDPQGQLLSAMLAAQAKNNGLNLPIYGLYSIGQFWFFVLLVGKEYSISKAFDATDSIDLTEILCKLQFVKEHIERNV